MAFSRNNYGRRMRRKYDRMTDRNSMGNFLGRVGRSPITKAVGIGVAGYFAYKWGRKFYEEHPEIGEFIRDNLETVEDKFREYRENLGDLSH